MLPNPADGHTCILLSRPMLFFKENKCDPRPVLTVSSLFPCSTKFFETQQGFFSSSHTNRQTDELGRFTLAEERTGDVTAGCLRWQVQVWSVCETFYLSNNPDCLIHHQVWIPMESLMDNRTAGWLTFKHSFAMNRCKRMRFLIWLQYKSYTWTTTTKYTQTWFCSCAQTNQYSRSHYINPQ